MLHTSNKNLKKTNYFCWYLSLQQAFNLKVKKIMDKESEDEYFERQGVGSTASSSNGRTFTTSTGTSPKPASKPPLDIYNFVYVVVFMLGMGCLLPWNFFINANEYFKYKFRNVTHGDCRGLINGSAGITNGSEGYLNSSCLAPETSLQKSFESYFSLFATIPSLVLMFANAALTRIVPLHTRMVASLVVMIASFLITVVFVKVDTDSWQKGFFILTLLVITVISSAMSFVSGSLYGLCGMFPPRYTQGVMVGMGLGGIFASLANIFSLIGGSGQTTSAFGYFMSAAVVLALCLVAYLLLYRSPFARHYMLHPWTSASEDDDSSSQRAPLLGSADGDATSSVRVQSGLGAGALRIVKKIWADALAAFLVFAVTLSCFPAVCAQVTSMYSASHNPKLQTWADPYYSAVMCFLNFNLCDTVGRMMAGKFQILRDNSRVLPVMAFLRVAFIPLFMYCRTSKRNHLPVVFHHDAYFVTFVIFFGLSNGYLGTLAMMKAPKLVSAEDTEQAGTIMSFFMTLGLAAGSAVSFLLVYLI